MGLLCCYEGGGNVCCPELKNFTTEVSTSEVVVDHALALCAGMYVVRVLLLCTRLCSFFIDCPLSVLFIFSYFRSLDPCCLFFSTLILSSFWTSRGHRCRPFYPPVFAFNFYRA